MKGFIVSVATWIWGRWRLFLGHIAIIFVVLFMVFYVDGRQFYLTHQLSLNQINGSITRKLMFLPVQSDITTLISIFASVARLASTLWVVGIDLRCALLFMDRGGVTFKGLKSVIGGSLPGHRQFRRKSNYIIFVILQVTILTSAFSSSVISGSVTWEPARKHFPGQSITTIPLGQSGDAVYATVSSTLLDSLIGYSTTIYAIFYDDAKNRFSTSMHRLVPPESVGSLPNGSTFEGLTVPYFSLDAFEWIKDPIATLSSHQLNAVTLVNVTGPRLMTIRKWGLIPDENWGPSEAAFPAPLTISESRILVMTGLPLRSDPSKCNLGHLSSTIPSDVQPYIATLRNISSCSIFANVTYRAGAARCRTCQPSGTVVRDVGDVRNLTLVDDPVTSVALGLAPYVSTLIFEVGYALPFNSGKFSTMQTFSIELLSRSYQVAWNALVTSYGVSKLENVNVSIAVDAPRASVLIWRVALWSIFHAILVALGFMFRHIYTSGQHPWIDDPVIAALLVNPTPIMNDPGTRAGGEGAPLMAAWLKLHGRDDQRYIVLERAQVLEGNPEEKE